MNAFWFMGPNSYPNWLNLKCHVVVVVCNNIHQPHLEAQDWTLFCHLQHQRDMRLQDGLIQFNGKICDMLEKLDCQWWFMRDAPQQMLGKDGRRDVWSWTMKKWFFFECACCHNCQQHQMIPARNKLGAPFAVFQVRKTACFSNKAVSAQKPCPIRFQHFLPVTSSCASCSDYRKHIVLCTCGAAECHSLTTK